MPEKLASGPRIGHDLSKVSAGLSRGPNLQRKLKAAPWSGTWPAPGSTLDLDFANNRGWVRGVGQGGVMDAITFTRGSTGRYIDSAGVLQAATDHVPRFDWASTAQVAQRNLLNYTQDFDNAAWTKSLSASVAANSISAPNGELQSDTITAGSSNSAVRQTVTVTKASYTFSVYLKRKNGTGDIQISASGGVWVNVNITDIWTRFSITQSLTAGSNYPGIRIVTQGDEVYAWGAQLELGSSATTYQPIAQPTTNTPLAANPTCNGILIEESRANRLLWCRDATRSGSWTCTNITPLKDQTGIDGVANAASSLTASADGGTCIQTITLASGSRTGSVYLKRLTGTGNVQVSLDGSTWSTVDLSSTEWRRIVLSGTVTNPVVGIKLATNGDAVAMDYGQVEDGSPATTPILTTTASATRATEQNPSVRMNPGLYDFLTRDRVSGVFSNSQAVTGSCSITANSGVRYVTRMLGFTANYLNAWAKTLMGVTET